MSYVYNQGVLDEAAKKLAEAGYPGAVCISQNVGLPSMDPNTGQLQYETGSCTIPGVTGVLDPALVAMPNTQLNQLQATIAPMRGGLDQGAEPDFLQGYQTVQTSAPSAGTVPNVKTPSAGTSNPIVKQVYNQAGTSGAGASTQAIRNGGNGSGIPPRLRNGNNSSDAGPVSGNTLTEEQLTLWMNAANGNNYATVDQWLYAFNQLTSTADGTITAEDLGYDSDTRQLFISSKTFLIKIKAYQLASVSLCQQMNNCNVGQPTPAPMPTPTPAPPVAVCGQYQTIGPGGNCIDSGGGISNFPLMCPTSTYLSDDGKSCVAVNRSPVSTPSPAPAPAPAPTPAPVAAMSSKYVWLMVGLVAVFAFSGGE